MLSSCRIFLVTLAVSLCSGRQLRRGHSDNDASDAQQEDKRMMMLLTNDDDITMYTWVQFGNRSLRCVMDTGSSEQVVFSNQCETCGGNPKTMYNCDEDGDCTWGEHETVHSYGSGEAFSREARMTLTARSINERKSVTLSEQMVWLVTEADFDFEMGGNMQCIFGLGPAKSALQFARLDYQALKGYVQDMSTNDAHSLLPELHEMKHHVKFMKGVKLWQEAAKMSSMSFCLHPTYGQNGRLILNDDLPDKMPEAFVQARAEGLYWQVNMTDVKVSFNNTTLSGCNGTCAAILDTGTSLIGAPWEFVSDLSDVLTDMMPLYGCEPDSLDKYPHFSMRLGGHKFHLPPHSYVCQFQAAEWEDDDEGVGGMPEGSGSDGADGDWIGRAPGTKPTSRKAVWKRMQHVRAFKEAHERNLLKTRVAAGRNDTDDRPYFCAPCFFELDQEEMPDGAVQQDQWIFGLPFFREYYTNFRTTATYRQARKVYFAKADEKCSPQAIHKKAQADFRRNGVQRVDVHKLRLPSSRSSKSRHVKKHTRDLLEKKLR